MIEKIKSIKFDAQIIAGLLLVGTLIWLVVRR
jgi:hypothetical protein